MRAIRSGLEMVKWKTVIRKRPKRMLSACSGEFSIRYGDRELAGNIGRSKKVWALVEYLLANRGKEIPLDRMMEELWPEEEYDNPFHILKNLVYRARMALKTLCGEDDVEFISFEHNCYTWNMSIPCRVDAELFDAYWQKSKTAADPDEKLEFARRAFEQYTGEFLPGLPTIPGWSPKAPTTPAATTSASVCWRKR